MRVFVGMETSGRVRRAFQARGQNPVMHGHALAIIGTPPSQSIQPYDFGEDASKRTCLLAGRPTALAGHFVFSAAHD